MTLPTGTVTLLFTDIEGSTELLEALGERYLVLLGEHHQIVRETVARLGGCEVNTEGDSFFLAFGDPIGAVRAAAELQQQFAGHDWPGGASVRARIGVHTGEPIEADGDYVGLDVHRAARITAAAHGQQVLLSRKTRELLPADVAVRDLGEHRLKDLRDPEWLYQLVIPNVTADFPPLRSVGTSNLPVPATKLIGRSHEVEELGTILRSEARLVTLTGVGGTGKTRLAIATAWSLVDEFPNGLFLVELAPIRDPDLVIPTIARVVGVRAAEFDALVSELRGKRVLLVVDNFEHLLDAGSSLAALVNAVPELKLLVTSRAPLRLTAEREYAVSPLAVPAAGENDPAAAAASPAVRVLVDRIEAVRRNFELTSANAPAIAEIARRLDGLPLALELAAAQARHASPEALLRRLERRLDVLVGGPRDLPERQQTLRAAIDWSYRQLSEAEQQLLGRLSVFAGGWTLDAAERICEAGGALALLLDSSLVRSTPDEIGEARFSTLETIREFALERLSESGEDAEIAARHAAYFLGLARDAEARMSGPDQPELLRMLEREHDNLRAAFDWALEHEIETALALGSALQRLWYLHGYIREGLERLQAALEQGSATAPLVRARALRAAGTLAEGCGDFVLARELLEQSIELLRDLDQPKDLATSLNNCCAVALQQGDLVAARAFCRESLELKRALGDTTGILMSTSNLAIIEAKDGQYESSRRRHEEILPALRQLGYANALSNCLASLGEVALLCGDPEEGRTLLEESLALRREVGDKAGIAESLLLLARAESEESPDVAVTRLRQSLELALEIEDRATLVSVLEARADLEAVAGEAGQAVVVRAAAERIRGELGAPFSEVDRTWRDRMLARVSDHLTVSELERRRIEGESGADEEVIAWALEDIRRPTPV
jgi:predicted ATPase/class 3 adenylate cyclase